MVGLMKQMKNGGKRISASTILTILFFVWLVYGVLHPIIFLGMHSTYPGSTTEISCTIINDSPLPIEVYGYYLEHRVDGEWIEVDLTSQGLRFTKEINTFYPLQWKKRLYVLAVPAPSPERTRYLEAGDYRITQNLRILGSFPRNIIVKFNISAF